MALKLAKDAGLTDVISTDQTNPLTTQHEISGTTVEVKVYLFNDNPAKLYESIAVKPVDTTGTNESTWIQLAPDNAGVAGTYLAGGEALSLSDISDSNVGKPFWVKVTTDTVSDSQNKSDISLRVTGTEFAK